MSARLKRVQFDDLGARLQTLLRARVERLGYLGEFFQVMAAQADLLAPFIEMTDALKKTLPERLTEVGALTVATLLGNKYELHQHEQLSKKLGFGEEWVAAVQQVSPLAAPILSFEERAVQRLVIAIVTRSGTGVAPEMEALIDAVGCEQTIAVMFLVGRYMTHALIVNSLGLAPPVDSIFGQAD